MKIKEALSGLECFDIAGNRLKVVDLMYPESGIKGRIIDMVDSCLNGSEISADAKTIIDNTQVVTVDGFFVSNDCTRVVRPYGNHITMYSMKEPYVLSNVVDYNDDYTFTYYFKGGGVDIYGDFEILAKVIDAVGRRRTHDVRVRAEMEEKALLKEFK